MLGRERYLNLLIKQLMHKNNNFIDEITLCVNTKIKSDLEYINFISEKYDKIKLLYLSERLLNSQIYIGEKYYYFFSQFNEPDTIYFKIDDDVIFLSKNYFIDTINFLLETQNKYLTIFPYVINNPLCTPILNNKIDINTPITLQDKYEIAFSFYNIQNSLDIHNKFLNNELIIPNKNYEFNENAVVLHKTPNRSY